MTFKPSVHGWTFANDFRVEGAALGLGTAPAEGFGLAGGMCWAALDRYLDARKMPPGLATPQPGEPLHDELLHRQIAALAGVWDRVRRWQTLPDGSWRDRVPLRLSPGRRDVASLTRREWRRLRRALDRGQPTLLTLVIPADGYARPTAARQVLAYGYARAGAGIAVSVYDPARPRDNDVRLAFSLRGPLDARLSGGDRVRGFFTVPYDRTPLDPLRAETFADRSVVGLNRKIQGSPAPVATRRGLHLVARDADRALIHFQRPRRRHWESANVTEREGFGTHELYCDPAAIAGPGGLSLHVFSRSYVGDLLHFRLGRRRWRVANRTDHRRTGPRFRLDGDPVAVSLPRGGVGIVARGKDGLLIAYAGKPFQGWRADEVHPAGGARIAGDPAAAPLDDVLHVVARSREGHVLHFERTRGGWSAGDLTRTAAGGGLARLAGDPALIVHEGALHVLGRGSEGKLVHLDRMPDGRWTAGVLDAEIAGDPAVTAGPAGVHAFAATADGGLVHAWRALDGWRVEPLPAAVAAEPAAGGGTVVAWGSSAELRVLWRRGGELVQWLWSPDAGWVVGPVSERAGVAPAHQPGEDPVVASDRRGRFHLFATDGTGTVVHYEPGSWGAPGQVGAVKARAVAPKAVAGAAAKRSARPAAASGAGKSGKAAAAASARRAPVRRRDPEPEPEPLPLLDDAAESEPEALPLLDDAGADPEPLPLVPEAATADPDPPALTLEPAAGEPDPVSLVPEPEAAPPPKPRTPAAPPPKPPAAPEPGLLDLPLLEPEAEPAPRPAPPAPRPAPAAPAGGDDELFEWELPDEPVAPEAPTPATSAGADVEPIDLETLENWPPLKPTQERSAREWPE